MLLLHPSRVLLLRSFVAPPSLSSSHYYVRSLSSAPRALLSGRVASVGTLLRPATSWSSSSRSPIGEHYASASASSQSLLSPLHMQLHLPAFSSRGYSTGIKTAKEKEEEEEEKDRQEMANLSFKDKVAHMTRKYGWVALGTYIGVYVTTFSSIALALMVGVDVQAVIETVGLARWIDPANLNPGAGVLVIAFILNKFTSPLRIVIVATITPYIARLVRRLRPKS